jgi:hypothetical protein
MWLGSHDTHFLEMTVAGFVVATTLRPEWYSDAAANYCLLFSMSYILWQSDLLLEH